MNGQSRYGWTWMGWLALLIAVVWALAVGPVWSAASAQTVYGDGLDAAWMNWSWNTQVNFGATSPVHGGSKSLAVRFDQPWAGLYLRASAALPDGYDRLRFWIHGGSAGGQRVGVLFFDVNSNAVQAADLTVQAGSWQQVEVPLSVFGSSADLWGLVWQDFTGGAQPRFYLDDIELVGSGLPPTPIGTANGPALRVDAAADQRPISPLIYGLNFADPALAAELRLPVNRWGGNATTRYNWQNDSSNRASDWYFENIPDDNANPGALPFGSSSDQFVAGNRAMGTETILTIPMIGWTPRDRERRCGFSVAKYGAQQSTDPWMPDCGNGVRTNGTLITGNDPADTSVAIGPTFVQDWMRHLIGQFGTAGSGGVRFYNLDNEPSLWNSTHRDVRPQPLGYDELRDRTYVYAAAIKAVDPAAQTLGPVEWGWTAYFYSALDMAAGGAWWNNPLDRNAHGGQPLVEWYLDQMRLYEQQHGVRILDYLDLHYYPQAAGVALSGAGGTQTQALRLRSTRGLWDPTYVDESWINEATYLIPRMRAWVEAHYPGTKIALTEYNWGALDHLNGALAQADILGIFGREGVDLATVWSPPNFNDPGAFAFRMYRNYDGAGGAFGETRVRTSSDDQGKVAAYGALRSDGKLTVMVINKTNAQQQSPLTLAGFDPGVAAVYRYSGTALDRITREADVTFSNGAATLTFPAQSITLLVIAPSGTVPTPPTPIPTPEVTPEPTMEPTPEPTAEPSAEPTVEPTAEPTAEPTVEPTAEPTTEITAEPTTEPTAEPTHEVTPEPSPTPTPAGPRLTLWVEPETAASGAGVTVALRLEGVADVYGLQADCQVDPAVLSGTSRMDGEVFSGSDSFYVDAGYQADGHWRVAASRLNPAVAFAGDGTAFTLNYTVVGVGHSAITCEALAVDIDGRTLEMTVSGGNFSAEGAPTETPTPEPTVEPTETPPTPTETPVPPTETPTPGPGAVSGMVAYQNRGDAGGITVMLIAGQSVIGGVVTTADGAFAFSGVAPGEYLLMADAPGHLAVVRTVQVAADQGTGAPALVLPAGDTDDNQVIDLADAGFIGANFGLSASVAPPNADLNGDGIVNIVDLTLVGGNFGKSGPVMLP